MKNSLKLLLLLAVSVTFIAPARAQSTRKEKQAAKIAAIKKLIDSARFSFDANYANPQRGGGRALTDSYFLKVSKDTISAYLPYFGRAYTAPIDPNEGPIDFTFTHFDYSIAENKKGGWDILIKPKDKDKNVIRFTDIQLLRLSISSDGYAYLQVLSSNRDPISFNGVILEIKANKPTGN